MPPSLHDCKSLSAGLSLALAVTMGLPAQVEAPPTPPQPVASSALLLRVQSPRCTLDTAREVALELGDRQLSVRLLLFKAIARHYGDGLRAFDQARQKIQQRARRTVPRVQRDQLASGGADEVGRLQQEARKITRGEGLSKQRIKDELDPRLARLRELVLVAPDDVLDADDDLVTAIDDLYASSDDLLGWYDLYLDNHRSLAGDEAGARALARHDALPEPPAPALIDADLELQCLMALPMSKQDQKALAANLALAGELEPGEYQGTLELNRIRIALGLNAVRIDARLAAAARDHSTDMKKLGFFSHTSPVEGKRTPGQRAANFGTSGGTENIAAGQSTGRGAIRAWWYSPGHHKNMLGGHSRTGLGRCDTLWTQMFGS